MEIQIPILESYRSRISSSLDAYETLSSSFVRAVPGALAGQSGNAARLTSGVDGLSRLVKALVSAKWMVAAMQGWGEDLVSSLLVAFSLGGDVYAYNFSSSWSCGPR